MHFVLKNERCEHGNKLAIYFVFKKFIGYQSTHLFVLQQLLICFFKFSIPSGLCTWGKTVSFFSPWEGVKIQLQSSNDSSRSCPLTCVEKPQLSNPGQERNMPCLGSVWGTGRFSDLRDPCPGEELNSPNNSWEIQWSIRKWKFDQGTRLKQPHRSLSSCSVLKKRCLKIVKWTMNHSKDLEGPSSGSVYIVSCVMWTNNVICIWLQKREIITAKHNFNH